MRISWDKHLRAFLRALCSDEPIYFIAHPKVYEHLITFTKDTWDPNTVIPELFSFYSPVIYLLINFAVENEIGLPDCFYALLNQMGQLSKGLWGVCIFFGFFLLHKCHICDNITTVTKKTQSQNTMKKGWIKERNHQWQ